VNGSSRMISFGSWISAPASATFCRMPLDRRSQRSSALASGRANQQIARAALRQLGRRPPTAGHEGEILHWRQFLVDHRLVRHHHDPPRPNGIGHASTPNTRSSRDPAGADRSPCATLCLTGAVRPSSGKIRRRSRSDPAINRRPLKTLGKPRISRASAGRIWFTSGHPTRGGASASSPPPGEIMPDRHCSYRVVRNSGTIKPSAVFKLIGMWSHSPTGDRQACSREARGNDSRKRTRSACRLVSVL